MKSVNIKTKSKKGFTIIEVVLVLAIAGLIFIMVFVALPALQRNQRDAQRRNDVAKVAAALDQYKTNNRGKLPTPPNNSRYTYCTNAQAATIQPNNPDSYDDLGYGGVACKFIATQLNSNSSETNEFIDPEGLAYSIYIYKRTANHSVSSKHRIYIDIGSKCDGEKSVPTSHGNEYAVLLKLEGAGTICIDNQ